MNQEPLKILKNELNIVKELSFYDNEISRLNKPITFKEKEMTHIKISFKEQFNSYSAELGILRKDKFHCVEYFEYCDYADDESLDYIELVEI